MNAGAFQWKQENSMSNSRYKAIHCMISRGGFSDERIFEFPHNGQLYQGVASRRHMWTESGAPLEEGEPPLGQQIRGLVAAHILQISEGKATVSIPDGEVIAIPVSELIDRPAEEHVPIRS